MFGQGFVAHKTETLWFHVHHRTRKLLSTWLYVQGEHIKMKEELKHLDLTLDGCLNFETHFNHLGTRVNYIAELQGRLLPNIVVPDEKLYFLHRSYYY